MVLGFKVLDGFRVLGFRVRCLGNTNHWPCAGI